MPTSFSLRSKRRGVPFDYAQGRLSTVFGCRLTSLRMTAMKRRAGRRGPLWHAWLKLRTFAADQLQAFILQDALDLFAGMDGPWTGCVQLDVVQPVLQCVVTLHEFLYVYLIGDV